jgi:4-amino-4-deoxy-L-arabinose transferase-like glycosyltransferase
MRMAMLDAALVCCAILSMEGLWDFVQGRKRRGWALFFIGCGVGALAKGPLGAALPVAALVGYAAFARNWRILLDIRPFSGAALSLAIFGLWAVPALVVTRGDYFIELVWVRTIQPVFSPLQGHGGSNLGSYLALLPIYVPVVFLGLWTWSPFLVSAARDLKSAGDDREGARLLAGWIVGQFVLMSLVSTKLLHYVLPFFPALAIVIGRYLAQMAGAPGGLNAAMRRFGVKGFVGPTLALAALMLAAPFATGFAADWPWFALTAVVAAACAIALLRQLRRGAGARAPAWIAVGALLPIAFLFSFSLPRFDRGKAPARLAQFLHSHYGEVGLDRVAVGLRRYRENSFMYYLNRTAEKVETDRMREFLDRPTPAVIVVPGRYLRDAEADGFDYPYTVIWSEMTWVAGRNRWERLLAISNGLMPAVEGQIERASSDSSGRARSIRMQVNAPSVIVTSADSR